MFTRNCILCMFKQKPFTINVTEDKKWTAKVPYDSACKYPVKLQAIFETKYCGEVRNHSDMSKPVYFGKVTPLYTFIFNLFYNY